ncbi:MAG: bifunctional DNA-formamidopyrimidine glycosylase/DNA-(apurinic or apyrimidinic site) lyase [candidate division KSB1 bacterium]|nr:bifunctional DNA-formamidopyrimidine glycosylase/DNA-(apurinic or apyrimidinic site) lyase [candidate division KSB1 bacterium]
MPELPEVETIRRGLEPHLYGKRLQSLRVHEPRLRWPVDEAKIKTAIENRRLQDIRRRAKYLLFDFEGGQTLLVHLGMSGQLRLLRKPAELERHDHIQLFFEGGLELRYRDPRRFGMMDVVAIDRVAGHPRLQHLGAEPLDETIPADSFYHTVRKSRKPIKNLLMDATFMVGVGNIYANEALFYAGVHPETPAQRLPLEKWCELLACVRQVLRKALREGGTTLNDFVDSRGEPGYFQLSLAVYGREGEPCPQCGSAIQKTVLTGRGTFFCPRCQPFIAPD